MDRIREIAGFDGKYMISENGVIYSLNYRNKPISNPLKPYIANNGYLRVALFHKSKQKQFYVHRLVCEAFIAKRHGELYVNHKNGIKTDNRASNLEWVTQSNNVLHAIHTLKVRRSAVPVSQYAINGDHIKNFKSVSSASKAMNISCNQINAALAGRSKSAGGYIWRNT